MTHEEVCDKYEALIEERIRLLQSSNPDLSKISKLTAEIQRLEGILF